MRLQKCIPFIIIWMFIVLPITAFSQQRMEIKYAQDVFNKLIKTINLSSPPKPILEVVPGNSIIAQTNNTGKITIGYGLIDHCRSFGKDSVNALAHILSHELTHYYSNHFWSDHFGSSYADLNWGKLMENSGKSLSTMKMYETQADEYGMYYSFAAGYRTINIGDKVLDSIYRWYHLDQQLPGYPSLMERKAIAGEAKNQIAHLIPLFETGNLLLLLAQIQAGNQQSILSKTAGYYFDEILSHKIQTKELYNNSGIATMMSVLILCSDSVQMIHFPFLLETKSILYTCERSRGSAEQPDSISFEAIHLALSDAENKFNDAIRLDKYFFPAYINLSICNLLQDKYGSASDAIAIADKLMGADNQLSWAVDEMKAIISYAQTRNQAEELFRSAINRGSSTAAYNMDLLLKKTDLMTLLSLQKEPVYFSTDTTETYNNVPLFEFLDNRPINSSNRIDLSSESAILYTDTLPDYLIYSLRSNIKPSFSKLRFMVLRDQKSITTFTGLHKGDTVADLEKLYGAPSQILFESNASVYSYNAENLFVWIENETIVKWAYWWMK